MPGAPWALAADGTGWSLAADVALTDLAVGARRSGQPCPALVHLGTVCGGADDGAELYVDLEALGLLEVRGPHDVVTDVVRAIATSLAVSPVSETLRGLTVGLDADCHLGNTNLEEVDTVDAALDLALAQLGSTATLASGRRTFALRARGGELDGESWEPVVVLAVDDDVDRDEVAALARGGGRGLAVVLGTSDGASHVDTQDTPRPTVTGDGTGVLSYELGHDGRPSRWRLDPLGIDLHPVGLDQDRVLVLHDLLESASLDLPQVDAVSPGAPPTVRSWALMVRLLGQVHVVAPDGSPAIFGRSKSLELTAWLALHRDRPTRTAARTALWELDVRAETFANVVSDARRSLARCVAPPAGTEWIERTLSEHLPLDAEVVTDAELVRDALERARMLQGDRRATELRGAVELVTGPPFAGTDYLWPHAEGITSSLLLLATSAAAELARCCLELGDIDGVFWATGRGLQVVPGHEELIALRMRAHAQRGDLAGVRTEWEVYERALHADPWSAAEPSPKLASVRRELLSR